MKPLSLNVNLILITLLVALLYTVWAFYIPLTDSYFYSDDTQVIWFAATKSIGQILFSPEHYRDLSGGLFQPILGLSFKIDWLLFEMEPKGYYFHNLLSVFLTGAALFTFMRLYVNNLTALISTVLFLLNPVTISVFIWCTTRHYMEGMFFALLSLYFFTRADRAGRISIPGAAFYLLASLYKEVYVLLPVVAFFISRENALQRIKNTLPMWLVLFLYIIWRFWMLGGMGGYPFHDLWESKILISGIKRLLKIMPLHFFGSYHALFWLIITVMFITMDRKRDILRLGIILIVLLIPTLPVLILFDSHFTWARYIFHLSVFLTFVGTLWGEKTFKQRRWRSFVIIPVLMTTITLFLIKNYELKAFLNTEMKVARETAEEFLYSGRDYIKAAQPAWFYEGLRDINEYFYGKKINTKFIPGNELIDYISEERRLEIISLGYDIKPEPERELRGNIIKGKILVRGYRMSWELGPYKTGYFIVGGSHKGLYTTIMPLKSRGEYLFGKHYPDDKSDTHFIRIIYKSPEGWVGVTDEYKIEFPGNSTIIF